MTEPLEPVPTTTTTSTTHRRRIGAWARSLLAAGLTACSTPMPPDRATALPTLPRPESSSMPTRPDSATSTPATGPAADVAPGQATLQPAIEVRTWGEYRRQAAERMVAASPKASYLGRVPDNLLAIPVLEVELNRDGSVRRIDVLRHPRQARDTTQLAIDAVHRAAPFGHVGRLPRPWKFAETFLFDDDRRFKPRTLD